MSKEVSDYTIGGYEALLEENELLKAAQYGSGRMQALRDERDALLAERDSLRDALSNLLSVYAKPDELICCNGRECGCMGASVYEQAEHYARLALQGEKP